MTLPDTDPQPVTDDAFVEAAAKIAATSPEAAEVVQGLRDSGLLEDVSESAGVEVDTIPEPTIADRVAAFNAAEDKRLALEKAKVEALDPGWTHGRLEYKGDHLAIRTPSQQALAGFSLSSGKYVPIAVKNDITSLFISEHLGPDSYGRMMQRLMNGDDADYSIDSIGDIMGAIVKTSSESDDDDEDDDAPDDKG